MCVNEYVGLFICALQAIGPIYDTTTGKFCSHERVLYTESCTVHTVFVVAYDLTFVFIQHLL